MYCSVVLVSYVGVVGQGDELVLLVQLLCSICIIVGGDVFDIGCIDVLVFVSDVGFGWLLYIGEFMLGLLVSVGIVQVVGQSLYWVVGEVFILVSGLVFEGIVQGSVCLYGGQVFGVLVVMMGMLIGNSFSVVSGLGELVVQVQDNWILVQLWVGLCMVSVFVVVELVVLIMLYVVIVGGVSIILEGGNFMVICLGIIIVYVGSKLFVGLINLIYLLLIMLCSELFEVMLIFVFCLQDIFGLQGVVLVGQLWKIVCIWQVVIDIFDNLYVVDVDEWVEVFKEGSVDGDGKVMLDDVDCKVVWDVVVCFLGCLYLVYGIDVILLQMCQFSIGLGVCEMVEILDVNNYSKDFQLLFDSDVLCVICYWVEYEFQFCLIVVFKQCKEI